jgi:hypothetical protein
MSDGYQPYFKGHFGYQAQEKLPETHVLFDVPKGRLNIMLSAIQ